MSDLEDFEEFVNYVRRRETGARRYLRDYSDPFTKYSVREFHARYRFSPHAVKDVIIPLLEFPEHRERRGLPFAPEVMVLITLRYFATGNFQKIKGDIMDICQQSICRIIAKVSTMLAKKIKDIVKFPTTRDTLMKVKQKFYEIAEFPNVIGCIDCTHIKIRNPGGISSEAYRNRKGWFSIKVQAVTGPNMEFYDIVVRWPGSTPNNFIYNNSTVKQRLIKDGLEGVLLGDNGYEVSDILLTPFLSPNSYSQEQYNERHIKTRSSIDRVISTWKKKFPCLQLGMGIKTDTVVVVICACATLYNVSLKLDEDIIVETDDEDDDDMIANEVVNDIRVSENPNCDGFLFRQSFVERYFSK